MMPPSSDRPAGQSEGGKRKLLKSDNTPIKVVPDAVRAVWTKRPRVPYSVEQARQDRERRKREGR